MAQIPSTSLSSFGALASRVPKEFGSCGKKAFPDQFRKERFGELFSQVPVGRPFTAGNGILGSKYLLSTKAQSESAEIAERRPKTDHTRILAIYGQGRREGDVNGAKMASRTSGLIAP